MSVPGSHSRRRWNRSSSSRRMSSATQRRRSRSCYRTWRCLMLVDMPSMRFGLIAGQPRRRNQHSRGSGWINRAVFKTNVQAGWYDRGAREPSRLGRMLFTAPGGQLGPPGGVDGLQPSLYVRGTRRNSSACIDGRVGRGNERVLGEESQCGAVTSLSASRCLPFSPKLPRSPTEKGQPTAAGPACKQNQHRQP